MKVSRAHIAVLSLIQVSLSFTTTVYPQSGFRFQHYTTADGIPTNFVSQVVQDGQGYLWFKHQFELSRFNGYNFKVYKNNPDDSLLNLGQNLLGSLTIDQSGDLWINSLQDSWQSGSLFKYDRKTDGFIQYKPDLKGAFINSMAFDRRQPVVWLAGRFGRGLFSFNLETYETKSFVDSPIDSLTLKFIGNMQDCGSFLLLGSRQGLRTFDKATKAFGRPKCNSKDSTILLSSPIGVANHDEHNNHWMYKPAYKPDDRTTFLRVDLFNYATI
jgi:ligand-binding sensor domain-containing protein